MFDIQQLYAIGQMIGKQAQEKAANPETTNNEIIEIAPTNKKWKPGNYEIGEIVRYENLPYKCVQKHDSTENPNWNPVEAPALWANYHATDAEHALPWVQPTGAHDIYKTNEYMIYTDGKIYKCLSDTNFSPTEYSQAWEVVE